MANHFSYQSTTESVRGVQEPAGASNLDGSSSVAINEQLTTTADSKTDYYFRSELIAVRILNKALKPSRTPTLITAQFLGEFVGTFLFLFFAFAGTQVANNITNSPDASTLLYISLSFGFSLTINCWAFYKISGGLFNPAVTLGLYLAGCFTWVRSLVFLVAQLLGSIASAGIVSCIFPGRLHVATELAGGTSIVRGLFIEMFLTTELVFVVLMLAVEKHRATFLAPIGIGLALFVAEMSGVAFTGGSLNPARSMAPDIVLASFPGYFWIYWVGPLLGATLAVEFYRLVRFLEYDVYGAPTQDSQTRLPTDRLNIYPIRSRSVFSASSATEAQRPATEPKG